MKRNMIQNIKQGMKQVIRLWCAIVVLVLCLALAGCGNQATETENTADSSTEDVTEASVPVRNPNVRRIPEELPDACTPVENPGDRTHFSFSVGENTYEFTETDNLWMYNQSVIGGYDTQFLLSIRGNKVVISLPSTQEAEDMNLEEKLKNWVSIYSDDNVEIYREEESKTAAEEEILLLKVYDMTYQVSYWPKLVNKGTISLEKLYTELAQMGTAIVPVEESSVSDLITAMSATPVFENYRMAFREGASYSGFIFCSPSSETVDYEDVSIYMSVLIPEWGDYATVRIEDIPSYQNRLEDTGETFDGYPVLADYVGELKYFVIGEDGTCVSIEGLPGEAGASKQNYSPKEAAYIFHIVLEELPAQVEPES